MFCYIFFHGRRGRRKRQTFAPPPVHPGTKNLYPEGTKIHRSYDITRQIFRKDNIKWLEEENYIISGDYIRHSEDGQKEVFVNTLMSFVGKTIFMYNVYEYSGLKDGSAWPSPVEIYIDSKCIRAITAYRSGNSSYMRMKLSDPKLPEEMLFEFNGPDAHQMAEEARRRILNEKETVSTVSMR
ncbi:MAG: hypothetical protein K2J87_03920 [Muribaculaceae bacterium]|nr:hypothetical protein [Muribaculaceae bacterium]